MNYELELYKKEKNNELVVNKNPYTIKNQDKKDNYAFTHKQQKYDKITHLAKNVVRRVHARQAPILCKSFTRFVV